MWNWEFARPRSSCIGHSDELQYSTMIPTAEPNVNIETTISEYLAQYERPSVRVEAL
jgi:hypothetical protein